MNSSEPTTTTQSRNSAWVIVAIVAVGVALRVGVICLWPDKLRIDTDAYLAYATAWAETGTFGYAGQPTAFRPPAYPWLLSVFGTPTTAWVAAINVLSGAGAIVFVWLTARRLQMTTLSAALAALLIAIDPLLVLYAGQAMTESLCKFESALLLWLIANAGLVRDANEPNAGQRSQCLWSLAAGVVGGLSVLTRPTFLVFGVFLLIAIVIACWLRRRRPAVLPLALVIFGAAIPVGAWGVRNQLLLGTPIITTTHGGYTLLLGNNADYYREVVDQSSTTEWDGVEAWAEELNRSLSERALTDEVERDRAMRDEAIDTIRNHPGIFVRACVLRCLNFWAITPSGEARAGLPTMVVVAAGAFYIVWWLLSVAGFVQAMRTRAVSLLPAICLIAAFASVHTVYWSNARMRAPVLPALALLAAYGLSARRRLARRSAD